jgi:mannose-6-phosphate isomerase
MSLTSLVFAPIYKEVVWGGRRLEQLGKTLPTKKPIGESWELVDLAADQSRVASGALAGRSLSEIVTAAGADLLGPVALDGGRFPLLVKFIDAAQTLSVQVHPDEGAVARMGRGRPKNEAWYILDAAPGGVLYLGLEPGASHAALAEAIAENRVEELLHRVAVRPGDLIPVRAGTVHAIGAGVLLAEVQQPSDTTYRVYDWGRVGLDGKPRELHVADALACVDLERRPEVLDGREETAVDAGHFRIGVVRVTAERPARIDGPGPRVVIGVAGCTEVRQGEGRSVRAVLGDVVLVPHCIQGAVLHGEGRVLLVSFPVP